MRSAPPITLEVAPSRALRIALAAIALCAMAAVWVSGAPLPAQLALTAAVAALTLHALRDLRTDARRLVWHPAGHWRLHAAGRVDAAVLDGARVLGPLVALRLRTAPRRVLTLWLLPDNVDADTRRRLRLRLARGASADI